MNFDEKAFNLIATSLSKHFDSLYYVDLESGEFEEFVHSDRLEKLNIPAKGKDFFRMAAANATKCVHPDDMDLVLCLHTKETAKEFLSKTPYYSLICRNILNGKIFHVRHVFMMCDDKKHIICAMENIEAEFQAKEEQERSLRSAEQMARRDELTGIKNKNAFAEFEERLNTEIKIGNKELQFGVLICDLNNLKQINDTRGHSLGDEAIQRTSRMICDIFKHSPVFRIGGDEFAALLSDSDFEHRKELLKSLKKESYNNMMSRTGPTVACGLAVYNPQSDCCFDDVFKRADSNMYENKKEVKSKNIVESFRKLEEINTEIPAERKRLLDSLFGALVTVAGGSYIYLNDMRYDFSRWSLPIINDFDLEAEYMYHADKIWEEYIHPDDLEVYRDAVDAVLCGNAELKSIFYRARKPDGTYVALTTRGFVLCDSSGKPEYFGGIIIPQ